MISKIVELYRYRELIVTLVSRDLKARYRGTILGFFWSFFNPLLLLLVYSVIFGMMLPNRFPGIEGSHYSVFLFSGILPWTWFNASIIESSNVLFAQGNLIKKIQFPVEVFPIVVVLTNLINFLLGLPILLLFFLLFGKGLTLWLFFLPVAILVQLVFTMGLSFLVSALTVHFRDLKDILSNLLTLWFFATPIIYPFSTEIIQKNTVVKWVLTLNPMTHIIEAYHYSLYYGSLPHWKKIPVTFAVGLALFYLGYLVFDRLRDTFVEEV